MITITSEDPEGILETLSRFQECGYKILQKPIETINNYGRSIYTAIIEKDIGSTLKETK